jgi:hypothetical protein
MTLASNAPFAITDDHQKAILEQFGDKPLPEVPGYFVLLARFVRPDKVALGKSGLSLYVAPKTQKEDEYQGQVGLVLAVGPEAYNNKAEPWCKPGDWRVIPKLENGAYEFPYGGLTLCWAADDRIGPRVTNPMDAL